MAFGEPPTPAAPSRQRLVAPLTAAAIVLALLVGGGIAAFTVSQSASSDAPTEPGPLATPAPAYPIATFDVREADGARLTLLPANIDGEALSVTLREGVTLEALVPGPPSRLAEGQWLLLIGEGDPVRNSVIRQVIALTEPGAPGADGLARSAAGFTGAELVSNPLEQVVLWGRIERVTPDASASARPEWVPRTVWRRLEGVAPAGGIAAGPPPEQSTADDGVSVEVTLAGPDGPITVVIQPHANLFFVEPYDGPIAGGDRIATRAPAGMSPANAEAILVAPQGAR